jgi:hypothetical protein
MRQQSLSTTKLLELLDLFERSEQSITDAGGQVLRGVPGWELFGQLSIESEELSFWTERTGYAGMYPALRDDERVAVELHDDDDPQQYWYRCPQTFRKKYVVARDVGVYAVSAHKILNQVADLLDISVALRSGIESPVIDGALWRLGGARIGPALIDVWFVRGLAQHVQDVFRHFQSDALPELGLILTSGVALPNIIVAPRQYRILPVRSGIVAHATAPCLDMDLIRRLFVAPTGPRPEQSMPVRFDTLSNTLVIATKSNHPWAIKGPRQVAVVQYLFEQAQHGRWWVPAREILTSVYGAQQGGRSRRIQNIFAGNTVWQDYITTNGKGMYGFLLD